MPKQTQPPLFSPDQKQREKITYDLVRRITESRVLEEEHANTNAEYKKRHTALSQQIEQAAAMLADAGEPT